MLTAHISQMKFKAIYGKYWSLKHKNVHVSQYLNHPRSKCFENKEDHKVTETEDFTPSSGIATFRNTLGCPILRFSCPLKSLEGYGPRDPVGSQLQHPLQSVAPWPMLISSSMQARGTRKGISERRACRVYNTCCKLRWHLRSSRSLELQQVLWDSML
jgi:hypothetical protein